uniref:methyltransferase domain-containing protein n=1 Tax=Porticoccus sp. TaxID=2024853 RepID=UPI003F69B655
ACCDQAPPDWLKPVLGSIHDEVLSRYYGCGLVVPPLLEGARILDLGCGSGRDVYALSALVGESGFVLGVDMTAEQLEVAQRHRDYHRQQFGYAQSNVEFRQGYLEQLADLDLPDNSVDIVVSNCVLNLCTDKEAVLEQVHRLLKPGGEFYFSDIYADRRLPTALQNDPVLYGECLAGALYWNDFVTLAKTAGFADPRLVEDRPITIDNGAIANRVAPARFHAATYRLFKIAELEPACEDYGQAVVYKGTVPHHPNTLILDKHHVMQAGRVFPICGNSYRMLHDSRFASHFDFIGTFERHYGIFPGCGQSLPFDTSATEVKGNVGDCC